MAICLLWFALACIDFAASQRLLDIILSDKPDIMTWLWHTSATSHDKNDKQQQQLQHIIPTLHATDGMICIYNRLEPKGF